MLSNGLPWLTAAGREILVEATGRPVLLRGVNRSGLEYADPGERGFLEAAGISESEVFHIAREWGANIIRVPFNQDWALNGRAAFPAAAYLDALDRVIFWASRAGAYTLLDLQWLDAESVHGYNSDGSPNRVPCLPVVESIGLWSMLAQRYRSEPAVLYDLFNEPHDPIPDDAHQVYGISEDGITFPLSGRRVRMTDWQPWARHLVRAIRREHARALIFVSGVDWGYDLRGMPLTIAEGSPDAFPNLVYSTHVYPWKGQHRKSRGTSPLARRPALSWREAFGDLSRVAPVFVGEWGGGPEHVPWGTTLARYLRRLGIGWTAWSWSDRPRLVVDAQTGRYEATGFGQVVRRAARSAPRDDQTRSGDLGSDLVAD